MKRILALVCLAATCLNSHAANYTYPCDAFFWSDFKTKRLFTSMGVFLNGDRAYIRNYVAWLKSRNYKILQFDIYKQDNGKYQVFITYRINLEPHP